MDDKKVQLCCKDDSKVALVESNRESKESASCGKTGMDSGANKDVSDGLEHLTLDEIEVKFCSGNTSKVLSVGNANEIKGKNVDPTSDNDAEELIGSSKFTDEATPPENAEDENEPDGEQRVWNRYENPFALSKVVPQNSCHEDGSRDDDFSAKDLLCFAWQIARGMVSSNHLINITYRVWQYVNYRSIW